MLSVYLDKPPDLVSIPLLWIPMSVTSILLKYYFFKEYIPTYLLVTSWLVSFIN